MLLECYGIQAREYGRAAGDDDRGPGRSLRRGMRVRWVGSRRRYGRRRRSRGATNGRARRSASGRRASKGGGQEQGTTEAGDSGRMGGRDSRTGRDRIRSMDRMARATVRSGSDGETAYGTSERVLERWRGQVSARRYGKAITGEEVTASAGSARRATAANRAGWRVCESRWLRMRAESVRCMFLDSMYVTGVHVLARRRSGSRQVARVHGQRSVWSRSGDRAMRAGKKTAGSRAGFHGSRAGRSGGGTAHVWRVRAAYGGVEARACGTKGRAATGLNTVDGVFQERFDGTWATGRQQAGVARRIRLDGIGGRAVQRWAGRRQEYGRAASRARIRRTRANEWAGERGC